MPELSVPGCCCGGECCGCVISPNQWKFPLSLQAAGICVDCPGGEIVLTREGANCAWGRLSGECQQTYMQLYCQVNGPFGLPDGWYLTINPGRQLATTTTYFIPLASWQCLGANTLTLRTLATQGCEGYPETITITPV